LHSFPVDKSLPLDLEVFEELCYKLVGCGFDSSWSHWDFSLMHFFQLYFGPGVDSASSTNEYQEYFLGGKGGWRIELTASPFSHADCLEILGASTFWSPEGLSRPLQGSFYLLPLDSVYPVEFSSLLIGF
jgi:hypothetical protein